MFFLCVVVPFFSFFGRTQVEATNGRGMLGDDFLLRTLLTDDELVHTCTHRTRGVTAVGRG